MTFAAIFWLGFSTGFVVGVAAFLIGMAIIKSEENY